MRPAMPAIELSASIFCARDMRGTQSLAEYRNKPLLHRHAAPSTLTAEVLQARDDARTRSNFDVRVDCSRI
jgi:hypothetical protein